MKLISLLTLATIPLYASGVLPSITKLQYKKHAYLCFDGMQYIHDPDCPCIEKLNRSLREENGILGEVDLDT